MPDGHFRSPQPWNGQYSLKKSASKKVLILKKSRAKIPLVMGGTRYFYANWTIWPDLDAYQNLKYRFDFEPEKIQVHCY